MPFRLLRDQVAGGNLDTGRDPCHANLKNISGWQSMTSRQNVKPRIQHTFLIPFLLDCNAFLDKLEQVSSYYVQFATSKPNSSFF